MVLKDIFVKWILLLFFMVCISATSAGTVYGNDHTMRRDFVGKADTLAARAKACFKEGKYRMADSLYVRALALKKETFAEDSPEYVSILCDYVDLCLDNDKLDGLREKLELILRVRKETFGENSLEYTEVLNHYGRYLVLMAEFDNAEQALTTAALVGKEYVEAVPEPYIKSLLSLATLHLYKQDFAAAGRYSNEALELSRRVGDKLNEGMAIVCLGSYHAYTGDINKAVELFTEALRMLKKACGEEHPAYMTTLSNCASLHIVRGNYAEAEKMSLKALQLSEKIFGEEHIQYFTSLSVLASLYGQQYRFEEAEKMQLKSLELRKKVYGETNPTVVTTLVYLGGIYQNLGNYEKVEQVSRQALDIISLTPDAFKTLKANILTMLGQAYLEQKRFDDALAAFREAFAEQQANNLSDDYLSLTIAGEICTTLMQDKSKDLSAIEAEFTYLIKRYEDQYSRQSIHYLNTRKNLASIYMSRGEYEKALSVYKEVMQGFKDRGTTLSWHYVSVLWNYALTLNVLNCVEESLTWHKNCLQVVRELTIRDFLFLSEQEREQYWRAQNFHLKRFLDFAVTNYLGSGDKRLAAFAYNSELLAKNLLLSSAVAKQDAVYKTGNQELVAMWQQVKLLRNASRNEEAHELERRLIGSLKEDGVSDGFSAEWQDVRQMLAPGEAAIEIINCPMKMNDGELKVCYYALLLRADSEYPELIALGDEGSIRQILVESEETIGAAYSLLWEVMAPGLTGVTTLYIAPSGLFNTVSFAVCKAPDDKRYVTERYTIHNLLSTRDIAALKAKREVTGEKKNIVLFGGADFGLPSGMLEDGASIKKEASSSLVRGAVDNLLKERGQGFDFLPGSLAEVRTIGKIAAAARWNVSLFTDSEATEARLKSYSSKSPEVLHISTHGFYFSPPDKAAPPSAVQLDSNFFSGATEPMMRSGLLLSGANNIWTGKEPVDAANDGVLTAYEIANLDFTNTELVVLSACDTGLGDIDYSEGIYGLQRAFRLAGVKSMIISLWKVPDEETCALMSAFYEGWISGLTIKQAFDKAQQNLRNRYPAEPRKWGGFVLVE